MEADDVPWLLLLEDDDDSDAEKTIATLVERGQWSRVVGGWMVTPAEDDPKRARTRARQRAWRAQKRDATRRGSATRRDAADDPEFGEISGDPYPPPGPLGPGGVGRSPETRRDATRRDTSRDATRRDAEDEPRQPTYDDPESWRLPPLTEHDRELGRAKIRELGDQLRAQRADGDRP